jgi:hypothetical protein
MPSRIDRRPGLPPLLMLAALAGCAQWPVAEPGAPAPPVAASPAPAPATAPPAPTEAPAAAAAASAPSAPAEPAPRLLAMQERLRLLNSAELAREAAPRDPPPDAGALVEQALALLQLRALGQAAGTPPNGELARAQALLEPVARQPSPWQATAKLLAARLAEQRKLEEQLAQAQQQLREQQRRNEQLTAQIEALRAIERSLGASRPGAPAAPATPR